MTEKIDFVIPWVDGNDPEWQAEKERYELESAGDSRSNRFRDWDNLHYWFRGVEKFAPWVNNIFFVTWGHLPKWLNTEHKKLVVVNHKDYIPQDYLPTFSSHTIELNYHRIKDLSNTFIIFNDDTFIIKDINKEDFFRKCLPCDYAILKPIIPSFRSSIGSIIVNNMEIINTTFNKREVIFSNFFKWFNIKYKRNLLSNLTLMPYKHFVGFINPHLPNAYLKEVFEHVWQEESDVLDQTCRHRFRDRRDVNHWLFRYWQLVTGRFAPRAVSMGHYYSLGNNNYQVERAILTQKHKLVCLNDDNRDPIIDFEKEKEIINAAFARLLPSKSSFEL